MQKKARFLGVWMAIAVAAAEPDREVRNPGAIANGLGSSRRIAARVGQRADKATCLR